MHSPIHVQSSAVIADEVLSSTMSMHYDEQHKQEHSAVHDGDIHHLHSHAGEHGVDEDFLHELFQIADDNEISSDDSEHNRSMDVDYHVEQDDNDNDSNSSNGYTNGSGQLNNAYIATTYTSSSSLPHCISPEPVPSMVTSMALLKDDLKLPLMIPASSASVQSDSLEQFQQPHQSLQYQPQTNAYLQAPVSTNDGFVNAFLLVDPVRQLVFVPQQIISCQIGNRVEQMEFGPFMLPTFDKAVIEQFHQHVVNPYLIHGYQEMTATEASL
jgi:hypothetical protein